MCAIDVEWGIHEIVVLNPDLLLSIVDERPRACITVGATRMSENAFLLLANGMLALCTT